LADDPRPLTDADLARIEHDLAQCEGQGLGYCQHVVEFHAIRRLVADVRRMRALLERIQWTRVASLCPACAAGEGSKHAADCEIAAYLSPRRQAVRERPEPAF
jgi:hypothetical protein